MSHHQHLLTIGLVAAITACGNTQPIDPPEESSASALRRFSDCDQLREYATDAWVESMVQNRYSFHYGLDGVAESSTVSGDSDGGGDSPSDYSKTNNQEEGVDEPDMVKTDGEYIYIAQRGELTIVKSWPIDETARVASLDLDTQPHSMFLYGDTIAMFSYTYDEDLFGDDSNYGYGTQVDIIDVSDRENPQQMYNIVLEGYYTNARMIDGHAYIITNTYAYAPDGIWDLVWNDSLGLPEIDYYATDEQRDIASDKAREIWRPLVADLVDEVSDSALVPQFLAGLPDTDMDPQPMMRCDEVYHPNETSIPNTLSVVHIDLADPEPEVSATGLMANGWTVYASKANLYISQTSWWWWWGWGDLDVTTHIHRFALDAEDTIYEASGEVDGWLLNQFSMGEYADHLRVATTDSAWGWWGSDDDEVEPANNIFVLDAGKLDPVGEVTGIAPNEQIRSARFTGEKGYIVTFEQIDPLFTVDLSDPTNPRIIGELKLPGFSTYLHPYGEDYVLAVGFDGTDDGQILGFAVNLFDVSDFANPTLASQLTVNSDEWSWSSALWDHHAFTLHRGVLSVPIYTWNWNDDDSWESFSGMWVIDANDPAGGIFELGKVSHEDIVMDSHCLYSSTAGPCQDDYYWYAWMKRSVVIEDNLFSISDYGIKVTDLENPSVELASVLFWPAN